MAEQRILEQFAKEIVNLGRTLEQKLALTENSETTLVCVNPENAIITESLKIFLTYKGVKANTDCIVIRWPDMVDDTKLKYLFNSEPSVDQHLVFFSRIGDEYISDIINCAAKDKNYLYLGSPFPDSLTGVYTIWRVGIEKYSCYISPHKNSMYRFRYEFLTDTQNILFSQALQKCIRLEIQKKNDTQN